MTMPTLVDESQSEEISTSSQSLFETNNWENNNYDDDDDDDFRSGSHDDHLSSLDDSKLLLVHKNLIVMKTLILTVFSQKTML